MVMRYIYIHQVRQHQTLLFPLCSTDITHSHVIIKPNRRVGLWGCLGRLEQSTLQGRPLMSIVIHAVVFFFQIHATAVWAPDKSYDHLHICEINTFVDKIQDSMHVCFSIFLFLLPSFFHLLVAHHS